LNGWTPDFVFSFGLVRGVLRTNARLVLRVLMALGLLAETAPSLPAQSSSPPVAKAPSAPAEVAAIKSFRIVQEKDGPAVEILSTRPLAPTIHVLDHPDRLVIDLPNARLETQENRVNVQADQITALRANQFQQSPPLTRIVVDLLVPRPYTWDAAGNRLVVHLGKNPGEASTSPFQSPTVPGLKPSPPPVVTAVRSSGPLSFTDNDGNPGSAITAGAETAVLRLSSGGELHVCPGTTLSVTPSQDRHNLMFSMNSGAIETHLALDASSDAVMTPDFRILLTGPGEFHYAISADTQGNTCVRALPGNTASAVINELLGDRNFQVKANDHFMFHSGRLDRVDMEVPPECGCPPLREPPLRASANLPIESAAPHAALPPVNSVPAAVAPATPAEAAPTPAPPPEASNPNELHVQIDAPLVFHPTGPPPAAASQPQADSHSSDSPSSATAASSPATSPVSPAPVSTAPKPTSHPGFFKRLGGFFSRLFH
jgi:hypothetical protein